MPGRLIQQKDRSGQWVPVALWTTTAVTRLLGTYAQATGSSDDLQ